jgi:hypothetical protein
MILCPPLHRPLFLLARQQNRIAELGGIEGVSHLPGGGGRALLRWDMPLGAMATGLVEAAPGCRHAVS